LQRAVATEDVTHHLRLGLVDDQLAVLRVIAERWLAAHPQALLLGGSDLVADPLAGDLALELCEGQQSRLLL
jgi:hypothetical protein